MKLLIDMNLSPRWVKFLTDNGLDALHWSAMGKVAASDSEIMAWAVPSLPPHRKNSQALSRSARKM